MSLGGEICSDQCDGEGKHTPKFMPKAQSVSEETIAALKSEEVGQYSFVKVPKHTGQSSNWVESNFEEWQGEYETLATRVVKTS